jgi:hypothetical protein
MFGILLRIRSTFVLCESRFNIWIEAPVRDPGLPESRRGMSQFRLIQSDKSIEEAPEIGSGPISEPERELNSFINAMTSLLGPGACESLT